MQRNIQMDYFTKLLWSECVCLPQILMLVILMLNVMALKGEAFERCLGQEGGALVSGIKAPKI